MLTKYHSYITAGFLLAIVSLVAASCTLSSQRPHTADNEVDSPPDSQPIKLSPKHLATIQAHASEVHSICFTPNDSFLLSGGNDGTAKVWNTKTRAIARVLPARRSPHPVPLPSHPITLEEQRRLAKARLLIPVKAVAVSADGKLAAIGSDDGLVRVLDAQRWSKQWETNLQRSVRSLAFSPDSTRLTVGGDTGGELGALTVWDIKTGKQVWAGPGDEPVEVFRFSPDGSRLVTVGGFHLQTWDARSGKKSMTIQSISDLSAVAFSPDGSLLATGGNSSGNVALRDPHTGTLLQTLQAKLPGVNALKFSPDGSLIAAAANDRRLPIWDVTTGKLLATIYTKSVVNDIAFSGNDDTLAAGHYDGTISIWKLRTTR